MYFPGRERIVSMIEHRGILAVLLASLFFFVWMDLTLYHKILERPPIRLPLNGTTEKTEMSVNPFDDLSMKVMMMDPVNHYVHSTLAKLYNKVTNFSTVFYFISPNFLSFCGFLMAVAAAKCVSTDNLSLHWVAVFLIQLRCWFDAFDGVVARSRLGLVKNVSLRFTLGYAVDGIADAVGYTVFLLGCFAYLKRFVPKHRSPVKECVEKDNRPTVVWTSWRIFSVVLLFGVQLIITCYLWDRYIYAFHEVLETPLATDKLAVTQNEMLKSPVTLLVIWIWRICNAHAMIQIFLVAVFLHKQWEFLLSIQHFGFVLLFVAYAVSESYLKHLRSFMGSLGSSHFPSV